MKLKLFCLLVLIFLNILFIESRKKKKRKVPKKAEDPRDRHPDRRLVPQTIYCESCKAILHASLNNLYSMKSETEVMRILTEICNPDHFKDFKCKELTFYTLNKLFYRS